MSSEEAELVKYAYNCFGELKVTYFNAICDLCENMNLDYSTIRKGILASTYINDVHTNVPGNNNEYGFSGKCFPKDVKAFQKKFEDQPIGKILELTLKLNEEVFKQKPRKV